MSPRWGFRVCTVTCTINMPPRRGYESGKMPDLRVQCVLWQILELMGHAKPVRLKTAPTGAKVYLFLVFTIIHIALRPDKSGFKTGARGLDVLTFYRHVAPLERRIEQLTGGGTPPLRVQPSVFSPSTDQSRRSHPQLPNKI